VTCRHAQKTLREPNELFLFEAEKDKVTRMKHGDSNTVLNLGGLRHMHFLYLHTGTGATDEVYLQATQKGKHQQRHGMVGD